MSSAAPRFRRHLFVALAASLALAAPAGAAKRKKAIHGTRTDIALFPITRAAGANAELVLAVEDQLDRALRSIYGAVYSGDALRSRLRAPPGDVIAKCGGDVGCVTKLGKKLKVDNVFFADASAQETGIALGAYVLSIVRGRIEGTAAISIGSAAEVEPKLKTAFEDLFHVSFPEAGATGDEITMPSLVGLTTLDLVPLTTSPDTAAADDSGTTAATATKEPTTSDPATADATTITTAAAPTTGAAPSTTPSSNPPPAPTRSTWLTYSGIGGLVAGAAAAGLGAVQGRQSTNAYNKVDPNGPNTTDQLTAKELKDKGDKNVYRANLLFIIGGTLGIVGGALVAIDRLFILDTEPAVTITEGGAKASLALRF
jgi:hypothetical protein